MDKSMIEKFKDNLMPWFGLTECERQFVRDNWGQVWFLSPIGIWKRTINPFSTHSVSSTDVFRVYVPVVRYFIQPGCSGKYTIPAEGRRGPIVSVTTCIDGKHEHRSYPDNVVINYGGHNGDLYVTEFNYIEIPESELEYFTSGVPEKAVLARPKDEDKFLSIGEGKILIFNYSTVLSGRLNGYRWVLEDTKVLETTKSYRVFPVVEKDGTYYAEMPEHLTPLHIVQCMAGFVAVQFQDSHGACHWLPQVSNCEMNQGVPGIPETPIMVKFYL